MGLSIGVFCRWFDVPVPSPPKLIGALLVVAMTVGYITTDKLLAAKSGGARKSASRPKAKRETRRQVWPARYCADCDCEDSASICGPQIPEGYWRRRFRRFRALCFQTSAPSRSGCPPDSKDWRSLPRPGSLGRRSNPAASVDCRPCKSRSWRWHRRRATGRCPYPCRNNADLVAAALAVGRCR